MILEKIKKAQLQARKNRNKDRAKILTTLYSECSMIGKNKNEETTDSDVIKCIEKFKKNINDTIYLMEDSGADSKELETYFEELSIYDEFLPKRMQETQLKHIIEEYFNDNPDAKIGDIMKYLKINYSDEIDMKTANKIIREKL